MCKMNIFVCFMRRQLVLILLMFSKFVYDTCMVHVWVEVVLSVCYSYDMICQVVPQTLHVVPLLSSSLVSSLARGPWDFDEFTCLFLIHIFLVLYQEFFKTGVPTVRYKLTIRSQQHHTLQLDCNLSSLTTYKKNFERDIHKKWQIFIWQNSH